jgi:hypothetical protein
MIPEAQFILAVGGFVLMAGVGAGLCYWLVHNAQDRSLRTKCKVIYRGYMPGPVGPVED